MLQGDIEMTDVNNQNAPTIQGEVAINPDMAAESNTLDQSNSGLGKNPELIINTLMPGALYELNGCLLIYKNSTSTMQSMMKTISRSQKQEHNFFFIGHDGSVQSEQSTPYVNLPRNFFDKKNIKSLINLSLDPVKATEKMVLSPFFGYKFGTPNQLVKAYGGNKNYYYIDAMGTPHTLSVLPPPLTIPHNSVFFHAPPNRKGPSATNIKQGKYQGTDLKSWAATRGGRKSKRKRESSINKSKTMKN
jgi:hypothetical protein